jgi:ribosome-interacting GTPase 1
MPANLTPEYHRAEERFRSARTPEEKVAALEEMLRVIPKHKGTDHMQADLRARIAKLRRESAKKGGRAGFSYVIPREGAGQVALAGPPNGGKSALVRALTHATPAVGDYPFTTREPVPGMMPFEDVAFQLVDLPPLSIQHVEPWVFDLVRHADLVWLVVDGRDVLAGVEEVCQLLDSRRILLVGARPGANLSDHDGTARRKAMLVITRLDDPEVADTIDAVDDLLDRRFPVSAVSSTTGEGLDRLRRQTFEAFDIIRVYTKEPGRPADRRAPFTLPRGATVGDLAERIHKDLLATIKFARVWGPSAFEGQAVQKDHVLAEGDVVEIHA